MQTPVNTLRISEEAEGCPVPESNGRKRHRKYSPVKMLYFHTHERQVGSKVKTKENKNVF